MATPREPTPREPGRLAGDDAFRRSLVSVAAAGAVLTLGAFVFGSFRAGMSTAAGAAIATANLYVLGRAVRGTGSGAWRLVGLLKMFALFGGVWLLLTSGLVDPIPLVVGLGALPVGLVMGSMLSSGRANEAP